MLHIDEATNKISLTRGDTAYITVPITDDISGKPYIMVASDTLTLTVKKRYTEEEIKFQIVNTGTNMFHIKPEHTKDLDFTSYRYDIQLNKRNGDIFTVIEQSTFEILPEVTW